MKIVCLLGSPRGERNSAAIAKLKDIMEAAGKRYLKQVPVLAEPIIANSWGDK
jgi:hypothetical protein